MKQQGKEQESIVNKDMTWKETTQGSNHRGEEGGKREQVGTYLCVEGEHALGSHGGEEHQRNRDLVDERRHYSQLEEPIRKLVGPPRERRRDAL